MKNFKLFIMALLTISFLSVNAQKGSQQTKTVSIKAIYTCSMHPNMVSNEPGKCSKCSMPLNLSSKEEVKWSDMKLFSCPMHPEVRSDKAGICNKCGSTLKSQELVYSCPTHSDVVSNQAGKCKICGETLTLNLSPKEKGKYGAMKLFTCPMHPNEKSDKPGKCSICGMELKAS